MKPHEPNAIGNRQTEPSQSQLRPSDIAYVLFRHKWKILFFSLAGVAAAIGLFLTQKPAFVSEAKLLIRYVQESRSVGPMESTDAIRSPDTRGDNILNSEIELITSLDLAEEVANTVGVSNIIERTSGPADLALAAKLVRSGVRVDAPRKSNILLLSFRHSDPVVARSVMTNLVAAYLRMHARVHRALGVQGDLERQAILRAADLEKTEARLRELKDSLGIANLEEAKRTTTEHLARTKQGLLATAAELAEARATLGYVLTNLPPESTETNQPAVVRREIPSEAVAAYEGTLTQIESLKKRLEDLLIQYTDDSIFVSAVRSRIRSVEEERAKIEAAHPGINSTAVAAAPRSGSSPRSNLPDRASEVAHAAGLEARWRTLEKQLADVQAEMGKLTANEPEITELERKRALYEKDYRYYLGAFEEAKVEATLTSGRLANISVVQAASPPSRETETLIKLMAGALAGGVVVGLGLALLSEFYLDCSVRRSGQVSRSLNIPVFLTVPRLGHRARSIKNVARPHPTNPSDKAVALRDNSSGEHPSPLMEYAEALRDRVIMHFQIRELHHKPKLVGVTSCGRGAGATTLATTLAASLSETGEGNVLYIDANPDLGPSVKSFYRGKQAAGIASALDQDSRSVAKVNDNFYMAALNDAAVGGKVGVLPKKLANLLPQMKASDFDYIIFDLPPVTQTSATARVAGLLDMTLLVLESEKTHSDLAKQVTGLLKQSRADVAAVLNKHRQYLPNRLNPDL